MAAEQEVVILTRLAGTREFIAGTEAEVAALEELTVASEETGVAFKGTAERGFLMNQALFTMRRLTYGTTLALVASGVMALKWGWQFNSAMQTARVALAPLQSATFNVNKELDYLFNFTKYTPFQFKDITVAFRQMYGAFHPLGISVHTTNETIKSMSDALAFVGRTTPGALNRVAVALQHMAFQGRLTGQTTLQLARDGLPIYAALRKELGLTADQMHQVGQLGIPTNVVLQALNRYIETTPGYANAAYRIATGSLHGLFTTFKDDLSQIMGSIESGFFARIQGRLIDMNKWFDSIQKRAGPHPTVGGIVGIIFGSGGEKLLNAMMADLRQLWSIFTGLVRDVARSHAVWDIFYVGLKLLLPILITLNFFVQHFGWLLWLLIPALIAYKTAMFAAAMMTKLDTFWKVADATETKDLTFAQWLMYNALRAYYFLQGMIIRGMAAWKIAQGLLSVAFNGYVRDVNGSFRAMTTLEKYVFRLRLMFLALKTETIALAIALYERLVPAFIREAIAATIAWIATLGPIAWIIAAVVALVGLIVLLYFKWRWFHNLMNLVATGIKNGLLWVFKELYKVMVDIWNIGKKLMDYIFHPLGTLKGIGSSLLNMVTHPFGSLGGIFGLQTGGVVQRGGMVMVGEHGPELMRLPGGAQVSPLQTHGRFNLQESWMPSQIQPSDVYIDGKKVAQIVWSYQSAYIARA
jgi:tape measure domain-containing protein